MDTYNLYIYQLVGKSTIQLAELNEGDTILDLVGPLGTPTHFDPEVKKVAVVGGGVGCAIAYPQAKMLHNKGIKVDVIAGFRSKDIVILEDEFKTENLSVPARTPASRTYPLRALS